jgi:hypothetical protein
MLLGLSAEARIAGPSAEAMVLSHPSTEAGIQIGPPGRGVLRRARD